MNKTSNPAHLIPLLLGFTACDDVKSGEDEEDETTQADTVQLVSLHDEDALHVDAELELDTIQVAAQQELTLTWPNLRRSDLGLPLGAFGNISRVDLSQFPDHDAASLQAVLAAGTLQQRDVSMTVTCVPLRDTCKLADFMFEHGHPVDVVNAFEEGQGVWLVALYVDGLALPVARVALEPRTDSEQTTVEVNDRSSRILVEADDDPVEPLLVPEDEDIVLSWSDLTLSSNGDPLLLPEVDRVVLARVSREVAVEDLALRLVEEADVVWSAPVRSTDSVSLSELEPVAGGRGRFTSFKDYEDDDAQWFVALYRSAAQVSPLTVLIPLEPG